VAYASTTLDVSYPSAQAVAARFREEQDTFVREETSARIAELEALIEADPGKLDAVNALGVLYARYGMVQKAGQTFGRILAVREFLPALLNMGNLAFLAGDFESALGFCGRALALSPRNDQALLTAARIHRELENYGAVRDFYGRLKAVNPALAAEYGFLLLHGEESTRGREIDSLRRSVRWSE
jgi:tetratricopeptide (TPR) repeat protein